MANKEFETELKALLKKHNVSLTIMFSDSSDTHGIYDEGIGYTEGNNWNEIRLSHGFDLDANDIED